MNIIKNALKNVNVSKEKKKKTEELSLCTMHIMLVLLIRTADN